MLIQASADAHVTVIESFVGTGTYFTNAVTEIVAGQGAVVDHYKVQRESLDAFHVSALQANLGRDANFRTHSISLGGKLVRNDAGALLSEGTEAILNGLYIVNGSQHVDNHTAIDHAKPHGTSHELYKGILDGESAAVFNGKIIVRQDAQKTDSKQTNKNLVLSDNSRVADLGRRCSLHAWRHHRPARCRIAVLSAVPRHRPEGSAQPSDLRFRAGYCRPHQGREPAGLARKTPLREIP
jgi:Fe-S cluster assembly protein SufD